MEGKQLKAKQVLEGIIQPRTTSLRSGSFQRNVVIISMTYFVSLWILENILIQCLKNNMWSRIEELKVPFELIVTVISL